MFQIDRTDSSGTVAQRAAVCGDSAGEIETVNRIIVDRDASAGTRAESTSTITSVCGDPTCTAQGADVESNPAALPEPPTW